MEGTGWAGMNRHGRRILLLLFAVVTLALALVAFAVLFVPLV